MPRRGKREPPRLHLEINHKFSKNTVKRWRARNWGPPNNLLLSYILAMRPVEVVMTRTVYVNASTLCFRGPAQFTRITDSAMSALPHLSSFPFPSWRPFQSRPWCRHHPSGRGSARTRQAWLLPRPNGEPLDDTNSTRLRGPEGGQSRAGGVMQWWEHKLHLKYQIKLMY